MKKLIISTFALIALLATVNRVHADTDPAPYGYYQQFQADGNTPVDALADPYWDNPTDSGTVDNIDIYNGSTQQTVFTKLDPVFNWNKTTKVLSLNVSTVALSGDYTDLTGLPTLGSAASQSSSSFATSSQGTLAGTALQPAAIGVSVQAYSANLASFSAYSPSSLPLTSAETTALAGKFATPTGSTGQYVRGDGTLATFPSIPTGTVTSVALSSSTLTTSGTVTTSGSLAVNLTATGTAGIYTNVTTDAYGRVTAGTARSFNNAPSHSIVTTAAAANGFQVSAAQDALVNYSVNLSSTSTIGGASSAYAVLEICSTNSSTAANWTEIARVSNGQTITLAVALQSIQTTTAAVSGEVPAGYYARIRSVLTGTSSAAFQSGQEVLQ